MQMSTEVDGVLVTEVWVETDAPVQLKLEFAGLEGSDLVEGPSGMFALVAAMLSQKRVYFSRARRILSTDPFFGAHAPAPQDSKQAVIDADALWDFRNGTGRLMVTLENRSNSHVPIDDAALLAGWFLTCGEHVVELDGQSLSTRRGAE
jgi:hypothetical protein